MRIVLLSMALARLLVDSVLIKPHRGGARPRVCFATLFSLVFATLFGLVEVRWEIPPLEAMIGHA